MGALVSYELSGAVAVVTMDDGKVNVMSSPMQQAIHAALDRATADGAVVLLAGRPGVFSAGFDLATLRGGGSEAVEMVAGGFDLAARVLAFPAPVVMACTGHAVAMGLFLLLSGDYRVGGTGEYRLTANEVAIGLTLPHAATEIVRQRLNPADFQRATMLAEAFAPEAAVDAGILDRAVEPGRVLPVARDTAEMLSLLDRQAHAATKLRARRPALDALHAAIAQDEAEFAGV